MSFAITTIKVYNLYCWVYGDDPRHIFPVEIAETKDVGALKDAIKDKRRPAFDHIPANTLALWKVSIKFDLNLERNMEELELDDGTQLLPWLNLSSVFSDRQTDHLHIVVGCRPPATSLLQLFCYVKGESHRRIFQVEIGEEKSVTALQQAIKKAKEPQFDHISADSLVLWNVKVPFHEHLKEAIDKLSLVDETSLLPYIKLSKIIADQPPDGHIHIVVDRRPPSTSLSGAQSLLNDLPLNRSQAAHLDEIDNLIEEFTDDLPLQAAPSSDWPIAQPPLMSRSGSHPPTIPPNTSFRRRTVEGLYDAMMKERLIYVRGTPGSGKSTLLNLLHRYILEKDPKAFVRVTWSWPKTFPVPFVPGQELTFTYLQTIIPDFSRRTGLAFLLMDDAQDSFGDSCLWNKFLKDVIDRPSCYRVVVFCSYGSTTTPAKDYSRGTPPELRPAARMTLWPRRVREGVEVNGLLLDWNEFNEVVEQYDRELLIHPDLSRTIFELTVGHVGAVSELLRIILNKMKTRIRTEGPVTADTYYKEFSLEYIMGQLSGPFGRGLPTGGELSQRPEVSDVFRRLLVYGRVRGNDTPIQYCHRNGWLYAEDEDEFNPQPQYYTFASPLHHAALSWRLQPRDSLPQFDSPYAMSIQAIAKIKPSQLKNPIRRVGGGSTTPEAQYQDEYYRSLLAVTCGNVRISPEFASARGARVAGRIDFFIPGVKWGIEITREGDRLNQHASRFETSGAYGQWLKDGDMTDYVLLDCRTTPPRTSHPGIPNLYHAVFKKGYTEVCVFNNNRDRVWGPIALQENHDNYAMLL